MYREDTDTFRRKLDAVFAVYGITLEDSVFDLWWDLLQRFGLGEVRRALDRHMRDPAEGRFPPRPAHIVRLIQDGRAGSGDHEKRVLDNCYECASQPGNAFDRYLAQNRHCAVCETQGHKVPSEHVHVTTQNPRNFWSARWLALCSSCHDRTKGGSEPFAEVRTVNLFAPEEWERRARTDLGVEHDEALGKQELTELYEAADPDARRRAKFYAQVAKRLRETDTPNMGTVLGARVS